MSTFTCASTGQSISLTRQIARSGEGEVWQTNLRGILAKVYHNPTPQRIRKLEVMVAHPPRDPNAEINHVSFAWVKSVLQTHSGQPVGFLMPEISNSVPLLDVYNPSRRQKVLPGFNWLYLHTTAMNIASIIWAIHHAGYVLGDIKPENILVNERALPAIIDTDSFQVRHPQTGEIYHCPVGSEGFTPVELMSQTLTTVEQTEVHDRFRLGIIIYLLLFGDHPFKGKWIGEGDSPLPSELLRQGFWCYAPNSLIQAGPLTIPLEIVHPALQDCFLRCFNEGHRKPELRPTPADWVRALKAARAELVPCKQGKNHWYSKTYGRCYWCDRKANLGIDIFPALTTAARNPAVKAFKRASTTLKQVTGQWTAQPGTASFTPGRLLQTARTTAQQVARQLPGQTPTQIPTGSVNQPPAPASTSPAADWSKFGTAAVLLVGVFTLLIFLSRSKVDTSEIELTVVGVLLCLGLVAIGFLWQKVIDKLNP